MQMERMKKRKRLKKKMGGESKKKGAKRGNFDNLCPKLEEVKKNVIGAPK